MSLNQKYTWNDFLRENTELRERKVKRTSPEGKKAFEAAYKTKIKDVLKDRLAWIDREVKRVDEKRTALTNEIKAQKRATAKQDVQSKVGRTDKYLHRLEKATKRTKQTQKNY